MWKRHLFNPHGSWSVALTHRHQRFYSAAPSTAQPLLNTLTVVTGGTRGIGLATAKLFASQGSRLVVLGRDQARIEHVLKNELGPIQGPDSVSAPSQHLGFQCDVSIQKDVDRVIKEIASVGPIDHLIHSAGIVKDNLLVLQSTPDIESLIQNNLMGTIWVNKAVAKVMLRQRKGAIVNISSISGVYGNVGQTVYSATKAAMIGFSKSLSKELGSRGITVNTIAPGYTETDMMTSTSKEQREFAISRTSLGRIGLPEDIAEAAVFLARAKFITGQNLIVDGGLVL